MLILTKINKAKYIEDMYDHEYLYFNSLKNFRNNENDQSGRLDPKELNLKNEQLKTLTITVKSKEYHLHKILKEFNGQFMKHLKEPKINICSLFWMELKPNQGSLSIDHRILEMGDKALLILDWVSFFEILDSSVKNLRLQFSRRKVEYYDPKKFNGEITLHHKDYKFKYQNEYRILIAPTENQPLKIQIPGLKKISRIIDSKDLDKIEIKNN